MERAKVIFSYFKNIFDIDIEWLVLTNTIPARIYVCAIKSNERVGCPDGM